MRYIADLADDGKKAETLIILLPGAGHLPEDFITQGFASTVRERKLDIDLIMAELVFEHIADQSALLEMHDGVMQPFIASGYQNIWLAGISVGGYVAIAFAHRYPEQVKGLLLMAPYPGNRMTTNEIALAGGLQNWEPVTVADDDIERGNWYWLKKHAKATEVHLGYGLDDRFASGIAMMETLLPAENVDKVPGEQKWPVLQQL